MCMTLESKLGELCSSFIQRQLLHKQFHVETSLIIFIRSLSEGIRHVLVIWTSTIEALQIDNIEVVIIVFDSN